MRSRQRVTFVRICIMQMRFNRSKILQTSIYRNGQNLVQAMEAVGCFENGSSALLRVASDFKNMPLGMLRVAHRLGRYFSCRL
jgi:hypothetical protein